MKSGNSHTRYIELQVEMLDHCCKESIRVPWKTWMQNQNKKKNVLGNLG